MSENISITELRRHPGRVLDRISKGHEEFVIERNGKPVAALVPVDLLGLIHELEGRIDIETVRAALRESGPAIPWAQVKRKILRDDP